MDNSEIKKVVNTAFDRALSSIEPEVSMELRPDLFANEYTWLRVKNIFDLNNSAIRKAVTEALCTILNA